LGGDIRPILKTINGGATLFTLISDSLHADTHAIVFAPSDSTIMYTGNDGGIWRSADTGDHWTAINSGGLSATQFYSLALHPNNREFMIGGTQDNGTLFRKPDTSWVQVDVGDGGITQIDQSPSGTTGTGTASDIVTMYHTVAFSALTGYEYFTGSPDTINSGQWNHFGCTPSSAQTCDSTLFYAPIALGAGNPNTIYYGSDRLWRSADKGLTTLLVSQAPLVAASPFNVPISAIGVAPQNDLVRIVGMKNGRVFATSSGSNTLTDITGPIPACFIARAVIDPSNANTAYVTLSCFGLAAGQHIWKTTNLSSATPAWNPSGNGIPDIPVDAFVVDPQNSKILYAGTDIGVYQSVDGGATWAPFGTGLPRLPVFDVAIQSPNHLLRIATHGRGIWEATISSMAMTVISSANPASTGQSITFTATVTPVPPNGETVTFMDGGVTLGTAALTNGVASFSTSSLAAGNHTITAFYGGDATLGSVTGSLNSNPQVVNTLVNAAHFIGQSVPSAMQSGLLYFVSVTMQNTGTTTWTPAHYALVAQHPLNNTNWGFDRVALPNNVVPNASITLTFTVRAPNQNPANFQWQMVQDNTLFGELTTNVPVTVTPPPQYYQGCWADDSARALPVLLSSGGETVESCKLKAANAGLLYGGLQSYGYCFGGNNLGRYQVPESQCNTPCTANPNEMCGGAFRNSIWSTVQISVTWVQPSGVTYGPPNTLTVQGLAYRGTGTVQMVWRDDTVNGPWNTVTAQSTPDGNNIWANTIPSSNYCHSYDVFARYSGVTSSTFTYTGVTSGFCNETAFVSWIQPPWSAGFGPSGSLVVAGGSSGAPAGTTVTLWWSDITAGTAWTQGTTATPDANGTWYNYINNVNYAHQYSVYAVYDAYSTQTTQGPCTYPGNGSAMYCPR